MTPTYWNLWLVGASSSLSDIGRLMFKIKMQSRGGHRKKEWTSNSNSKSVFSFSISIFSLSPSLYLSFYIFCLSICIFISPLIFLLSLSYCFSSLPLNPSLPPFVYLYLSISVSVTLSVSVSSSVSSSLPLPWVEFDQSTSVHITGIYCYKQLIILTTRSQMIKPHNTKQLWFFYEIYNYTSFLKWNIQLWFFMKYSVCRMLNSACPCRKIQNFHRNLDIHKPASCWTLWTWVADNHTMAVVDSCR